MKQASLFAGAGTEITVDREKVNNILSQSNNSTLGKQTCPHAHPTHTFHTHTHTHTPPTHSTPTPTHPFTPTVLLCAYFRPAELQFYTSIASVGVQIPACFLMMELDKVHNTLDLTMMFFLLMNGIFFHFQSISAYVLMDYISPVTHRYLSLGVFVYVCVCV